ncbi:MAG: hypothetical protein PHI12_10120 [Dehalococcoidales bacterium]|nr:hypothetical protein [Dehalococcoidales bacterium]
MKITIKVPGRVRMNLTSVIKPLFDGVIAAFNGHDGTDMHVVTKRIAAELCTGQEEIVRLLEDEQMAILGSRRLVWPWREGIQWNPSDDRLVAGELSIAEFASQREWELSGELFEVNQETSS